MDATQTQYIRLHKEWNPRRRGRGARFGRGGGHQSKVISQRAYVTEREKTLIAALIEAHKEEAPPTEYTATIAPGMCAKIDEPGVMDSGANVSVTNPLTVAKFNLRAFFFMSFDQSRDECLLPLCDVGSLADDLALMSSSSTESCVASFPSGVPFLVKTDVLRLSCVHPPYLVVGVVLLAGRGDLP